MRRHDREITDHSEMLEVIHSCDVCRLAFNTGSYPYIIPMNFGCSDTDGVLTLYFHGAGEGAKYERMAADPHVSFEMDCKHLLDGDYDKKMCTMHYESIIGQGLLEEITDPAEKLEALQILCAQYYPEGFPFNESVIAVTRVLKLTVSGMTGKRR